MSFINDCFLSIFSALMKRLLPFIATCALWVVASTTPIAGATCLSISDIPMDTQLQAAPASVMFVIDDSGSMDWEFMTTESSGIFHGEYYNFDLGPDTDNAYSDSYIVEGTEKRLWKARWAGYNKMYYNPDVNYTPWPRQSDADTTAPRSNPILATPTLTLSDEYDSVEEGIVVDNTDAGFSTSANGWDPNHFTHAEEYGTNYDYTLGNDGTAWAKWIVDIPTAGNYEVFGWWRSHTDRVTNVTYDIFHDGVLTEDVPPGGVNQNVLAQWTSLGTYHFSGGGNEYIRLDATVAGDSKYTADAMKFTPTGSSAISIKNAHYYTFSESENIPYLVVLDGSIKYYRFSTNVDSIDQAGLILNASPPGDVVPKNDDGSNRSYTQELQNFANWFSFYRRRELTAKAAIANVIDNIEGVRIGFYSIWGRLIQTVMNVNVTINTVLYDNTDTLLTALYGLDSDSTTPLRAALKNVGDYFDEAGGDGGIGASPYASEAEGGACQQSFAIVMTDGFWNGSVSGIGNEDSGEGAPYADDWTATLADVAMKYYKADLSSLDDLVPTNFPDTANRQHMITYGISFGVGGTLDPDDYDLYNSDPNQRVYPDWPDPTGAEDGTKIDDLWHASVNGRGIFLSASDPEELIESLDAVMQNVMARIGSGASISINAEELHAGSRIYQASYHTDNWSGDVKAYAIDQTTGAVIRETPLWSASAELDNINYGSRIIATYNTDTSVAIPFQYNNLSDSQKTQLHTDPATAEDMLNFIRGDDTNEGVFRNRTSKLGDIVHSAPTYFGDVIYAGGNDGMLHAFDAGTGQELFAYIPGLVFANLEHLSNPFYSHQFYVDLAPYVANAGGTTLLVGGLGKGGKGYYCLDVTNPGSITSESALANRVKWEYPKVSTPSAETDDIGYSFSEAYIVESNDAAHHWVVIFGNGYESTNGHAVLFVLDALTGAKIAQIDTGADTCNGLSTPVPIDVDLDNKVDYVYAGDLNGNLWKFEFTGSASNWGLAYNNSALFQAKGPSGNPQPITTKPDVMFHCVPGMPGFMVIFGTGKYLGNTDFVDTNTQTIYGIWDYGDDSDDTEYLGSFDRPGLSNQPASVTLLEQTEIYYGQPANSNYTLRVLSQNEPIWATVDDSTNGQNPDPSDTEPNHAGWYFDLPITKERVVRNLMIRDGKVILISIVPKESPCAAGGDSIIMEMDACSGGRLGGAQFDINDDAKIDENDMIPIPDPGGGPDILVPPTGLGKPGILYPPKIVRNPDGTETKYFSASTGNIPMLREQGEKRGIYYWRIVD